MNVRIRSPLPTLAAACLSPLMASCGGGGGGGGGMVPGVCSATNQKQFVLDVTRDWYLFQSDLPASISPGDYPTAQELLDALTAPARAQGKDRPLGALPARRPRVNFNRVCML